MSSVGSSLATSSNYCSEEDYAFIELNVNELLSDLARSQAMENPSFEVGSESSYESQYTLLAREPQSERYNSYQKVNPAAIWKLS